MATADEYAAWIVQNADKRGTPDFDIVAQAYQEAKAEESQAALQQQLAPLKQAAPDQSRGIMETLQGVGEAALTLGTGAVGGTIGMITGTGGQLAREILSGQFGTPDANRRVMEAAGQAAQNLTYAPRSEAGQEKVQAIGSALQGLPAFIPVVGPVGAVARSAQAVAPLAQATVQSAAQRAGQLAQRGAQVAARPIQAAREAMGVAPAATTKPAAGSIGAAATPLEQQRIAEARMAGLQLTEGEIKRSPELMSFEAEKARTPEFQAPFLERQQQNNQAALAKFETLLDDTGAIEPGAGNDFSNTGIKVVDTLMKGWTDEKKKTNNLYNAFRESPEAQTPVNVAPLVDFLNSQPRNVSGISGITDAARQNAINLGLATTTPDGNLQALPVTLGKLEEYRQAVNATSGTSSMDKRLTGLLKNNIDEIGAPIAGKTLNAMRAQRRKQAAMFENRAIISRLLLEKRGMDDPQTPPELVFQKTILNAQPSEIQRIKRVLFMIGGDEGKQAWKELQGSTIRHLMQQAEAGIGADNLPVISGAKLNAALKNLDRSGKLDLVLGKEAAEQVRNLNQVLQYIQSTPPLTSVNNSGTARTIMALMGESAIQGAVTGIPLPIVQGMQLLRKEIADRKIRDKITKSLNYMPKQE